MSWRIVPIAEQHIDGFYAALDAVSRERRYLLFLEAPPLDEVRKFVSGNLKRGYPQVVALDGNQVVGWCDVLPVERPTRAHTGTLGLAVLAGFRGKGIGSALLRDALERARGFGLTRVELGVRGGNRDVVGLYERFGFTVEGVQRNAVRVDERYEDVILMGRMLS